MIDSSSPRQRLRRRIQRRGPISFAEFMEEALYGAGGYYARRELPIGTEGDFVTGSSFSPLFAGTTYRLLRRLDAAMGGAAELLEVGYGSGRHLAEVAARAQGERRRIRGVDRVERPLPDLPGADAVEIVADLDAIGEGEVRGLIFAYELFDALPVHRLVALEDGGLGELHVALDGEGAFAWHLAPPSDPALEELLEGHRRELRSGQIVDLAPGWGPLYGALARCLGEGLLVVCDYGFERHRLFDPRVRLHGTLACYHRQRVHRDPFVRVGDQDLTAHVDFTTLRDTGEARGLETVAFARQAAWLTACGLFEDLAGAEDATRRQAMKLLDGEGMGQDLRVLVQARSVDPGTILDLEILR